jgi:3-dehydroquinate synthetase
MQHDKKNDSKTISFVLPLENGRFDLNVRVSDEEIKGIF